MRFNHLFLDSLKRQLLLKNIITDDDWELFETHIKFDYTKDNYFEQQKQSSVMTDRVNLINLMQPLIGKYYSNEWVRKHILQQSDEEIEEMDEQTMAEQENPLYQSAVDENGNPVAGGTPPPGPAAAQGSNGGGFGGTAPAEQAN